MLIRISYPDNKVKVFDYNSEVAFTTASDIEAIGTLVAQKIPVTRNTKNFLCWFDPDGTPIDGRKFNRISKVVA
jgi:hypothetical protein